MSTSAALAIVPPDLQAALAPEAERARDYAGASKAKNSLRAYASQWRLFDRWCAAHGLRSLPAEARTVALYLAARADAGRAWSTIAQGLAAVADNHARAGHRSPSEDPEVRAVAAGIYRTIGTAQHGKAPLLAGALRAALSGLGSGLADVRDRALLLVVWHLAARRSELVALDLRHVHFVPEGLEITISKSKTDQAAKGRTIPIPRGRIPDLCPERALCAWIAGAPITDGALFRRVDRWGHVGDRLAAAAVATVVKEAAARAGLDPRLFAGHSARSGLVTTAARAGRGEASIMRVTGHASVTMLRRYIKEAERWRDVPTDGLLEG